MLNLVPGAMGGSETYAAELAKNLDGREDVDVRIVLPAGSRGFSSSHNVVVAKRVKGGSTTAARLRSQIAAELSPSLRHLIGQADVTHYPLTVPSPRPVRGRPYVQSLLDTQHIDLAHNFGAGERWYRKARYDVPAQRADAVVTISAFCKEQIAKNLNVPLDRIHVAHLGVDAEEFTPTFGERAPFVLYPARGWPHKNHARLIEAMHQLRATHPDLRLVLTGGGLDSLGGLPNWVEAKGLVSRKELLDLYQRASCLAFPSLYEGFGLPPLEAMASACPVAAARSGSLPEVCGDAAVLFDPLDATSIANGIELALGNATGVERGLRRVREFSWDRCADTHVDVYRLVASQHRRGGRRRGDG